MELMKKLREQLSASEQRIKLKKLDCKNGGLLIDGLCLCLNKFSGQECEIAPKNPTTTILSTTTISTTTTTSTAITTTAFRRMKAQKMNLMNENRNLDVRRQRLNNKDFTIITINRQGREGKIFKNRP